MPLDFNDLVSGATTTAKPPKMGTLSFEDLLPVEKQRIGSMGLTRGALPPYDELKASGIDLTDLQPQGRPEQPQLAAGKPAGALERIRQAITEKTGLLAPNIAPLGEPKDRAEEPIKTLARAGAYHGAGALSGLTLNALDILTNKTTGDRTLAALVARTTGFKPTEKEQAEPAKYAAAFTPIGAGVGAAMVAIPARQALKTIWGAGLTFMNVEAVNQFSKNITEGKPIDFSQIHAAGGVGELFGVGEVAVSAALSGLLKGITVSKLPDPVKARDVKYAREYFRKNGSMPPELMNKYVKAGLRPTEAPKITDFGKHPLAKPVATSISLQKPIITEKAAISPVVKQTPIAPTVTTPEIKTQQWAIRMKDGQMITAPMDDYTSHADLAVKRGLNIDNIESAGFIANGKYNTQTREVDKGERVAGIQKKVKVIKPTPEPTVAPAIAKTRKIQQDILTLLAKQPIHADLQPVAGKLGLLGQMDDVRDAIRQLHEEGKITIENGNYKLPALQVESPQGKTTYTSVPKEWHEHKILYDWGKKGLRAPHNVKVGKKKTFDYIGSEFDKVPVRLPPETMKAIHDQTDEVWKIVSKKGEDYYLAPRKVVEDLKKTLPPEAFTQKPKPIRTGPQRINDLINSAERRNDIPPEDIGEAILTTAQEKGIDVTALSDRAKEYVGIYNAKAKQAISKGVQPGVRKEISDSLDSYEAEEREAIQREAEYTQVIGDFLDSTPFNLPIAKPKGVKPTNIPKVQKDLLGQPVFGTTAGKQVEFLDKEQFKVPEPDIKGQMKFPPKPIEGKLPGGRQAGAVIVPEKLQEAVEAIKEISGEKIYQDYINRFASIENATKKAIKLGAKIQPGENPAIRAREYLGIGPKVKTILEKNTYRITPEGRIEITGEGLKPILDDYEKAVKPIEKNKTVREKDFNDYLIAQRTIEDLQRPKYPGAQEEVVTPKQIVDAVVVRDRLTAKYGANIKDVEASAQRFYGYQKRVLHLLVDSGNMSEELYKAILTRNPHYVPFDRILDEIEPVAGGTPISKQRFTGARSPIKKIKGSEREIHDPIESAIKNTYRIMDAAERNTVARNVAKLSTVLPEIVPKDIPIVPIAKIPLKAQIDAKLTQELLDVIDKLKGQYQRKIKIGGKRVGYFSPKNKIVTRFASQESVIAHELGHYIDELYNLQDKLVNQKATKLELRALADLRQVRKAYGRKGEEKVAALMDAYVTKPQLLDEVAPNSKRVLEDIIKAHDELKPLLKIRPSMEIQYETAMQTIFAQTPFKPKGDIIEYFEGGKKRWLKVTPNLYQAMSGLNETSSSILIQILSKPAQWLRTGATITPEFAFRNPIRDQWTATMNATFGFRPFVDSTGALADILGKSDTYYDWMRSGGAYSGFVELNRPALKKALSELRNNPNLLRKLNIITTAQDMSQLFEQATRVGAYKAAIRAGKTPAEAGFESREVTVDFGRRGAKTKDINSVIAFFNAGVQGVDKSFRAAYADPIGFTMKGIALITIPSLLLYLRNRKDPDFRELPRWQRDLFWITKIGQTYVRIPKPFLYGQIFGSMPERFFEYVDTKDPEAFTRLAKSLYDALTPAAGDTEGTMLATAIKPLIENKVNWNFFMQRPIVPEGKERLLPAEQYTKYTSETAKLLGKAVDYSPAKIENLVRGYFGGTGQYGLNAGDMLIRGIRKAAGKSTPQEKPGELSDIPAVRGFVARSPMSGQAESLQQFYDNREKILSAQQTVNKMLREGNKEGARGIFKKYPQVVLSSNKFIEAAGLPKGTKTIQDYSKLITTCGKMIDEVINSSRPTEEKREMIKRLERGRILLAREANNLIKQQTGNVNIPNQTYRK